MKTKVCIIGMGPSGLMAANTLKELGISFTVIDKNPIPGKKLLLTGGGRCNVTNNLSKREFMESLTVNKRFLYSTLSAFSTIEIINFFKSKGVELQLDKDFKYFPKTNRSKDILDALLVDIREDLLLNETVYSVKKNGLFQIKTTNQSIEADYVIVATGSASYPKTGSDGFGLKIAKSFGINTIPFYPAETSVYSSFVKENRESLQGVSIKNSIIRIKDTKKSFTGDIGFTHFGVSGPGIQHLSEEIYHNLNTHNVITVSLTELKETDIIDLFDEAKDTGKSILRVLEQCTINRVAKFIVEHFRIENTKVKATSKKTINKLIEYLLRFEVSIDKVEAKENAFVNGGGIDTLELNPKSFESKKVTGLFFIGETVDVHGPIGGFNITIATSMGHQSASEINNQINKKQKH